MAIRKALVASLTTGGPDEVLSTDSLGCGKLVGLTGSPAVSVSGVTGASVALTSGNDIAGLITVTLPTVALLSTLTVTVTPTSPYPSTPYIGLTSYGTSNVLNLYSSGNVGVGSASTANWTVTISIPILAVGGAVKFTYQVIC